MNIINQLADLLLAIASDTAITTWSEVTYGRVHKVFENLDDRNLPAEVDCPYVALYPISRQSGYQVKDIVNGYEILCCVHDESYAAHAEDNVVKYAGVDRLETLRQYVLSAIASVDVGNALLAEVSCEYDTVTAFPFMFNSMVLTFTLPVMIAGDAL